MKSVAGNLDGKGLKVALVASRFNSFINEKLIAGAKECLVMHGASEDDITLIQVPGAFEIPFAAKKAVDADKFDAVICLGTIIRGATSHYEHLASAITKTLMDLSMNSKIPVTYGVVATETIEQAIERAGSKAGNRGYDAAMSALDMVNLNRQKL